MADIKTVQLIVNSEQSKSSIRTAFERYSNRLHLKRYGIFSVQRKTIGMENLAIKNHKTLHNAIWKKSGPMQTCGAPDFSKMVFYKQRRCYRSFTWHNTDGFLCNSL